MKLVSDQTDDDIRRRAAKAQLIEALSQHAANLLRVVRGAGKPRQIVEDLTFCAHAFDEYRRAHQREAEAEVVASAFDIRDLSHYRGQATAEDRARWLEEGTLAVEEARQHIILASLQIVASRMLDQRPQMERGEEQLSQALRAFFEAKENRKRIASGSSTGKVRRKSPSERAGDSAKKG